MRILGAVVSATLLLAACAEVQSPDVVRNEAAPTPTHFAPDAPAVDIASFAGLGVLAFDWHGGLWLLDGVDRSLDRVDDAGSALTWSPGGEWLAYTKPRAGLVDLWVVRADGSARRRIAGLPDAKDIHFAWSPTADVLAVGLVGAAADGGTWIAGPSEPARMLLSENVGFVWSADGTTLIYATVLPFTRPEERDDALWTVPVSGGTPRQWLVVKRAGIVLQPPWPDGRGVLFFQDPAHSNSGMADGVPLSSYHFGDRAPRDLPVVAVGRPRWLPDGHSIVLLAGAGRFIWNNKVVVRCDLGAATCAPIAPDLSMVALEPAVSPDGTGIAFVRAPDRGFTGFPDRKAIDAWNAARRLWVGPLASPREMPTLGQGIFAPDWAPDSRHLLFIRDDAAWLTDDAGSAPRKLLPDLGLTVQPWSLSWPHAWHRGPAEPRRPAGFTLSAGCTFVTDGVASGRRYLWPVDCGAEANAHAATSLGPALASQGWTVCAGSGSPTWLKGDYALTVTDGAPATRGHIGLTQSPREIVSCR